MFRRLAVGLSAALLVAAVAAPVMATKPSDGGNEYLKKGHKVTICHALPDSASHPYNVITVDIASSGFVKGGHHRPGGEIGDKHAHGGDIIPPYTYIKRNGKPFEYDGQNWLEGKAIWENDCQAVGAKLIVVKDFSCECNEPSPTLFSFTVDGDNETAFEADGRNEVDVAGGKTYSVTETNIPIGWKPRNGGTCEVFVPVGGEGTCTITNVEELGST